VKFVTSIVVLFLAACGVEGFTDDLRIRQVFEIYTVGDYSFKEVCPSPGYLDNTISIGKDSIRMGHTVCDITNLEFSTKPTGPKISLQNCRSDGGNEEPAIIIIESFGDGTTTLHGWGKKPVQIYTCPKK